jgi:hypothetical protein
MDAVIFILFLMFIVLFISMIVGAVMFCVDIWKWSKRPEVFSTAEEDLAKDKQVKESKEGSEYNG